MKSKTRLSRAIDELKDAAGDRRFVLVVERAHRTSPKSRVTLHQGRETALWEIFGLLKHGMIAAEEEWKTPAGDFVP